MSIAFPAFQKAQNEHMGFERSRNSLSASIFESLEGVQFAPAPPASTLDLTKVEAQAAAPAIAPAKPRITKRINARLQLAAALVEADNDKILERAQACSSQHPLAASDEPRPPPPPEPKLASQSAIFAPYREGSAPLPHHRRTFSNASRISRLTGANEGGRRPSIDYLGVSLPTEAKTHSRNGSRIGAPNSRSRASSILSAGSGAPLRPGELVDGGDPRAASKPASLFGATSAAEPGEDALSDWGVDKFLSKEERDRIAVGKRSRANSVAGFTTHPAVAEMPRGTAMVSRASLDTRRVSAGPMADPGASIGAGRARSEIIASSGISSSLNSRADLLARIRLYRERQENLPPSEWSGPGPTATKDEVVEHLIATSPMSQTASLQQARRSLADVSSAMGRSNDTALAEEPTSPSILDRPRPLSRAGSISSGHMVSLTSANNPTSHTAQASRLDEIAGGTGGDHYALPTSKSFEHKKMVNTRRSHRHLSIFGVTGDNWSDQDQSSEPGDAMATRTPAAASPLAQAATATFEAQADEAPIADDRVNRTAEAAGTVETTTATAAATASAASPPTTTAMGALAAPAAPAAAAAAAPSASSSGPGGFVFPPPASRPGFALATSDQLEQAFGRRQSAILQQLEGSALAIDGEEGFDMAGIGSYSRSQSRRNSLTANAMLPPSNPGHFTPPMMPSRPGTPGAVHGLSHSVPEDPFGNLPLDPGPYGAGLAAAGFPVSPSMNAFPGSPGPRFSQLPPTALNDATPARMNRSTAALSTKQLQALARSSTFPEHLGIGGGLSGAAYAGGDDDDEVDRAPNEDPDFVSQSISAEKLADELSSEVYPNLPIQLGGGEPDLSSANWGKPKKKWFRASRMSMLGGDRKSKLLDFGGDDRGGATTDRTTRASSIDGMDGGDRDELHSDFGSQAGYLDRVRSAHYDLNADDDDDEADDDRPLGLRRDVSEAYSNEPVSDIFQGLQGSSDDVDDDFISPPRKGPLKPRGLDSRLPKTLIMPQPLQGTQMAPRLRLTEPDLSDARAGRRQSGLYVPDGFVLHDGKGLPPMRSLQVNSATGPRPLFASAGGDKRLEALVSDIKTVEVSRTLKVPAAAPRGIGRRAAAPTTALFRNQLVQHEEEKEGWGWEAGTRADDATLNNGSDTDEEVPLADLKKRGRAAKRAAKKLARAKRKRKQARRERRTKREQAIKEGRPFADFGVDELSPDEDLDLSSTTSGSEETEYESSIESWDSDDEKRWLDENKPAGKLFGKSLLDVAEERNKVRKTKARFYGQAQLEDEEMLEKQSALNVPATAGDDAVSLAPSAARTFRENPLGYNDTKERMEATFGTDTVWAREMAKRLEQEAKEKEEAEIQRLAEEEFRREEEARKQRKKNRRLFRSGKNKRKAQNNGTAGESPLPDPQQAQQAATTGDSSLPEGQGKDESGRVSPIGTRTSMHAPVIDLHLGDSVDVPGSRRRRPKKAHEAAAQWFVPSSGDEESEASSSDDEEERRRQAVQRVRLSRSLGGTAESKLLAAALASNGFGNGGGSEGDDSSSDDNVPLVQIKKLAAVKRASMAPSMQLNGLVASTQKGAEDESSEEELTLAAIKAKRQQANAKLGRLDLDFSERGREGAGEAAKEPGSRSIASLSPLASREASPKPSHTSSLGRSSSKGLPGSSSLSKELSSIWNIGGKKDGEEPKPDADEEEDSDEDMPLGVRHPNGAATLQAARRPANGDASDEDEDDRPLGAAHPQAAIIAEQAALIRQLQAEKDQQARMSTMPGPWPGMGGMPGVGGFGGGMAPSMMGIGMGMGGAPSTIGFGMGGGAAGGIMSAPPPPPPSGLGGPMLGMPPAINVDAASPNTVAGYLPHFSGPPDAVAMPMAMPISMPMAPPMGMMLDPKASTIHNWRSQVPADASGGAPTPTGSSSTPASAIHSPR